MTPEEIVSLLQGYRFRFQNELEFQDGIAKVLDKHAVEYVKEHYLTGRDKIDFKCGSVGIEVKVDGTSNALSRQVLRYLRSPDIDSIIVVTSRSKHVLPEELDGKKIYLVFVGGL